MRFFRQEYLSGLPFPTPGDLPHPGIEPMSPVSLALQANSLPTEPLGKPKKVMGSGPYREIKWNLILALNSMDITEKIHIFKIQFSSVVQSCPTLVTPRAAARQASLSFTNSWNLLKLMPIELVMSSNHLILYRPILLPPSIFPRIRIFSSESVLRIRWPKCWSFSFSISPSNAYSGLISFRTDWFDLFAVQGTLKSLLQHHS